MLAKAALGMKDYQTVDEYLKVSGELVNVLNMPGRWVEYNELAATLYYQKGQYRDAYDTLHKNIELQKSIFEQEQEKQAEKFKIQFDTVLLQSQNDALKKADLLNLSVIKAQQQKQYILSLLIGITLLCIFLVAWILIKQIRVRNTFKQLSFIDSLTNSPNRRAILSEAKQAFIDVKAGTTKSLFIAIIDIDWFKQVNDTYGHEVGDRVLYAFASACRSNMQREQQFGRFGGEEWLLVLNNIAIEDLSVIFQGIREKINDAQIIGLPNDYAITFSMGVASFDNKIDTKVNDMIARADKHLYLVKEQGRDNMLLAKT